VPPGVRLVTDGNTFVEALDDQPLFARFLEKLRHVPFERRDVRGTARKVIGAAAKTPCRAVHGSAFLAHKLRGLPARPRHRFHEDPTRSLAL